MEHGFRKYARLLSMVFTLPMIACVQGDFDTAAIDNVFADFNSAMSLEAYQAENESWYSYTGKPEMGWSRALDYVFASGDWVDDGAENYVMQDEEQGGYETLYL